MENHELDRKAFESDEEFKLHSLRHSTAHVLAQAMTELFPGVQLGNGPPVQDGFYYDFLLDRPLAVEDLPQIEARMREIATRDLAIERHEVSRDEALKLFNERGQALKVERISLLPADAVISTYSQDSFVDLCRGPHVRSTGACANLKLLSVAGAYWLGDAKNAQLQRVYGTVWPTKQELDKYLERIEQAKLRDHRKLGRELKLFMFHEWAPGCTFWLPRGQIVYQLLSDKMRKLLESEGYVEVRTPQLFDKALWETSGHWQHFKDDMFRVESESREFGLKPMNCPSHMLIYRSELRSYRDLPLRIHDQGVLHRNEMSGALSGLSRVRQFCQDDAHIFLPASEIGAEIRRVLALVKRVYSVFGLEVQVNLSTRPASFLGEKETWDDAEAALTEAIVAAGFKWKIKPGEGTFYGPKIDFDVLDAIGRLFQCATVQLDFQIPRRFELRYIGQDGNEHVPVVIHRAIFGSFERFIGLLIEHFAGVFPFWLAPEQCRVLAINSDVAAYAGEVAAALRARGLRVGVDTSDLTISNKVRMSQVEKIPYGVTVGRREQENRTVSLRAYGSKEQQSLTLDALGARLAAENDVKI